MCILSDDCGCSADTGLVFGAEGSPRDVRSPLCLDLFLFLTFGLCSTRDVEQVMNTGGLGTESPGFWMQGLASPLMYVCAGQEQGSVHLGI